MPLLENHIISDSMCKKISFSELNFKHLQIACGYDEIHNLYTETFQGKPRFTKGTSFITAVSNFNEEI